jgi:hypothetical protein
MARKLASSPAPRLQSFQAARQTVTVAWDSSAGATGYKLYWGTNSAVYRNVMSLTNLQAALQLEPLTTYFMAVTAENGLGAESPYSDELIFTTAAAIPTGVLVEVSILGADAVSGPYIPMSLTNSITEALTNGQRYYRALMTITPR